MYTGKLYELEDLFEYFLADLYLAEKKLLPVLSAMHKHCSDRDLKDLFEKHKNETNEQIHRIERMAFNIGVPVNEFENSSIDGMIAWFGELLSEKIEIEREVLDAAMIALTQKIKHIEIATYGTLCEYARLLGIGEACDMLEESLEEEKAMNKQLNKIASGNVNFKASHVNRDPGNMGEGM